MAKCVCPSCNWPVDCGDDICLKCGFIIRVDDTRPPKEYCPLDTYRSLDDKGVVK